jgi:hypothetical protein
VASRSISYKMPNARYVVTSSSSYVVSWRAGLIILSLKGEQFRRLARCSLMVDPLHDIDLVHGAFGQTSLRDLDNAFAYLLNLRPRPSDLCVFFHGGLVSRNEAVQAEATLKSQYTWSGAYPFFFIWNSDILTALQGKLKHYQDDRDFIEAANLGVSTVARKIEAALGTSRARAGLPRRMPARGRRLDLRTLANLAKQYDRVWSRAPGLQLSATNTDLDAFREALLRIDRARKRRRQLRRGGLRRRGLFRVGRIRGAGNPFGRVIRRFNSGHDHGLYTTVIEELFIAIGIDDVCRKRIWEPMKKDIDLAFGVGAGGTAFLEGLRRVWTKLPDLRVTLIGHSAGSIYVQRFIEALDASFGPQKKVEVITLAAAVSFERMVQGLPQLQRRVSALRVFELSDRREADYWEIPFIYNKSLLYIVCSLLEDDPEADKPLFGMQHYWTGLKPYNQPYIEVITKFIGSRRAVWSPTSRNARPGYRSNAKKHGDFATKDTKTEESVCYALSHGF